MEASENIATGITVLSMGIILLTAEGGARWLAFRVVAAIVTLVSGFVAAPSFGPDGSAESYLVVAFALWLPQLVLALLLSLRGVPTWFCDSPRADS